MRKVTVQVAVELDVHTRLAANRVHKNESLSDVIKRSLDKSEM